MLYCEKQHHRAYFFVAAQGRKQLAIAICKLSITRNDNNDDHIFMWYRDEPYCKGASKDKQNSNITKHEQKLQGYDNERSPMQQSNLYMLLIAIMMATCVFFMSYC
jgi:hypothetical protein